MHLHTSAHLAILSLAISVGCASPPPPDPWYPRSLGPSTVPASEHEQHILARLDSIPHEGELRSGELVALVEPPYHAASDRLCRRIRFGDPRGGQSVRTACQSPDGWQLAADVFGSGSGR